MLATRTTRLSSDPTALTLDPALLGLRNTRGLTLSLQPDRRILQLDGELVRLNEDYAAHRVGDLSMLPPRIRAVGKGGFAEWMKSRGKYGGQNKVPRMDNSGQITEEMSRFFAGA